MHAKLLRRLLPLLAAAVGLALAAAPSASAQRTLLDDILPPAGVCTCAVMEPPNDCAAALSEPRSMAQTQRGEVRAQCARDWRAGCEEQYGWQACSSQEANQQLAAQCDQLAERWWSEVAAPQITEMSRQCDAANASWITQCETVDRPANCQTCDDMAAEIDTLQTDIADAEAWLTAMRGGAAVLTPADEQEIIERIDEVARWKRSLDEKLGGYTMLQDTNFCPSSSTAAGE